MMELVQTLLDEYRHKGLNMAHADIFQKLNSPAPKETRAKPSSEESLLETLKIACRQIVEMKDSLELQTAEIQSLKQELEFLRQKSSDNAGNIQMALIDQKDIAKQIRHLKASINSESLQTSQTTEKVARKFYKNYDKQSSILSNSEDFNSTRAENIANEFIFGRMPKLLKL